MNQQYWCGNCNEVWNLILDQSEKKINAQIFPNVLVALQMDFGMGR